jgi:hypothetical protein
MSRAMARAGYRQRAGRFERPMVPAEFGYSAIGAAAAAMLACVLAAALYAFTLWPLETAGWLALAGLARALGRYPIAAFMK